MSEIHTSPFVIPGCGGTLSSGMKDALGGYINFQAVGTDPDLVGPVTGAYVPDDGNVNPDGTFFLIPETDAAQYVVVLANGTEFTITGVQATAYLGTPIPMRILEVISSTGYYSVIW